MQKTVIIEKRLQTSLDTFILEQSKRSKAPLLAFILGRQTSESFLIEHISACRNPIAGDQAENVETLDSSEHSIQPSPKEKTKSPRPKPSDFIDDIWIAHEARQVLRSLPGGLSLLGLLIICEKQQRVEFHPLLVKSLKSMHKASSKTIAPLELSSSQLLLLTIEAPARKPSGLLLDFGPKGNSIGSACPLSFQQLKWLELHSHISLDCPMLVQSLGDNTFHKKFHSSNAKLRAQIASALVIFNGEPKHPSSPLSSGKNPPSSLSAELFIRPAPPSPAHSIHCEGLLHLKGTMSLRAYVQAKCSVSEAEEALKEDFLRSLYSRADLHSEGMSIIEGEKEDPVSLHQLPRRVFARSGGVDFCDYLFECDTPEDAAESLNELLRLSLTPSDISDGLEKVLSIDELEQIDVPLPLITVQESSSQGENGVQQSFFSSARRRSASSSGQSSPRMRRSRASSRESAERKVIQTRSEKARIRKYFGIAITGVLVAMIFYAMVGLVG